MSYVITAVETYEKILEDVYLLLFSVQLTGECYSLVERGELKFL